MFLEVETLQDRIAIGPGNIPAYTATTQDHNCNDGNDDDSVVLLLGFVSNGGHLFVHDFFSLWIDI
jgi:hypothetical protein